MEYFWNIFEMKKNWSHEYGSIVQFRGCISGFLTIFVISFLFAHTFHTAFYWHVDQTFRFHSVILFCCAGSFPLFARGFGIKKIRTWSTFIDDFNPSQEYEVLNYNTHCKSVQLSVKFQLFKRIGIISELLQAHRCLV